MPIRGQGWRTGAGAFVAVLLGLGAGGCGGRRAMCERAVVHAWESNIPEEVHALLVAMGTSEGALLVGHAPAEQRAQLVDRCVSESIDSDVVACFAERPPSDLRPCAAMSQARQGR